MRCFSLVLALLALLAVRTDAQVVRVPKQFPTIQKALMAAKAGTVILVDPGVYKENIAWPMVDGIRLLSVEGPERTIIEGVNPRMPVVAFSVRLSRATLLQGFTVTGSAALATPVFIGSSPTLRFNHIVNNLPSSYSGGGIYVAGSGAPLIERNLIRGNQTMAYGAGIYVDGDCSPMIRGNRILANVCTGPTGGRGAGIMVNGNTGHVQIVSNLIAENRGAVAQSMGDAVAVMGGSVDLINNTIVANGGYGGGLASAVFLTTAQPQSHRLLNNIVAGNLVPGIRNAGQAPLLDFNNVWNNTGGDYVNLTPGLHDTSVDPRFAGPSAGYHLDRFSPMIDAGANLPVVEQAAMDFDGDPRLLDARLQGTLARADIGADEVNPVKLGYSGAFAPGGRVAFEVAGPPGAWFALFAGTTRTQVLIQPFGSLLVADFALARTGTVPGRVDVPIPPVAALLGAEVLVQGFVARSLTGPPAGAFTNRLDLTFLPLQPAIREDFSTTMFLDPASTSARWAGGPGQSGLHAVRDYGGDGSDGDLDLNGDLTLDSGKRAPGADGVVEWNYRTVAIRRTGRLFLVGPHPIRINVQESCSVAGEILLNGKNGLNAPPGTAGQVGQIPGGAGGAGGGAGGIANTNPTSPIGALPMELRGGAGSPRAEVCGVPNRSENRLITAVEPNCGGGTGGNRGFPLGTTLRSGCSGNGGGHVEDGVRTDHRCGNAQVYGESFGRKWVVPTGANAVQSPTGGTGGGAGGNAAVSSSNPTPANDIVAGSGGGAGGGLEIVAYEDLDVTGTIRADGGGGGRGWSTLVGNTTVSGGWGGGGAGGSIWLTATSVTVNQASLTARGGIGNPNPPGPLNGGDGGDGYIVIRDRGGNPRVELTQIVPAPLSIRALFVPRDPGRSTGVSLFYDAGVTNPNWAFDANDPRTGEVKAGQDLIFRVPPGAGQKVFIAFQGAPDLNGRPNPNPSTWFPPNGFASDIALLKAQGGLRHIRFRVDFDSGVREKGKPAPGPIAIEKLWIRY